MDDHVIQILLEEEVEVDDLVAEIMYDSSDEEEEPKQWGGSREGRMPNKKRDSATKARTMCDWKPKREWLSRKESASPTASMEDMFSMAMTDAMEWRDVMTSNTPNAFAQMSLKQEK